MATLDHRLNGNKWLVGTTESVLGPLIHNVRIHPNVLWKRHINQIIPMPQGGESIDSDETWDFSQLSFEKQNTGEPSRDSDAEITPVEQTRRYPLRERRPPVRYDPSTYL